MCELCKFLVRKLSQVGWFGALISLLMAQTQTQVYLGIGTEVDTEAPESSGTEGDIEEAEMEALLPEVGPEGYSSSYYEARTCTKVGRLRS